MKTSMSEYTRLLTIDSVNERTFMGSLLISALLHAVVLVSAVFIPEFSPKSVYIPQDSVINVSMVSFPASASEPAMVSGSEVPEPELSVDAETVIVDPEIPVETKSAPEPVEIPPVEIPIEPSKPIEKLVILEKIEEKPPEPPKPIEKLPEPAPKEKPVVSKKPKVVPKMPEKSRPQSVNDAIARIKQKLEQTDAPKGTSTGTGIAGGGSVTGAVGGSAGGTVDSVAIRFYRENILTELIKKNWAFPEYLAGGKQNIKAILVIKIMADGKISDIHFQQRSGNRYLDESARKAVLKSDPLPPLPRGYFEPYYMVAIGFTPSGLE